MQLVFCAVQKVLTAQDKVCYLTKEQKIIWCYNLKKSLSHQWWFQKAERSALLWNMIILGSTLHWLHKWFKTCLALRFSFLMIEEITKCPYYRWQWKKKYLWTLLFHSHYFQSFQDPVGMNFSWFNGQFWNSSLLQKTAWFSVFQNTSAVLDSSQMWPGQIVNWTVIKHRRWEINWVVRRTLVADISERSNELQLKKKIK